MDFELSEFLQMLPRGVVRLYWHLDTAVLPPKENAL